MQFQGLESAEIRLLLGKNSLFESLSSKQLDEVIKIAQLKQVQPGEPLVHEDEPGTVFYVLLQGQMEVVKHTTDRAVQHQLATLQVGDTVGELALLDHAKRSASVYALSTSLVLEFNIDEFERLAQQRSVYQIIRDRIVLNLTKNLRYTNEVTVKALRQKVLQYEWRSKMGKFLVAVIILSTFYVYLLDALSFLKGVVKESAYLSIPFLGLYLIFLFSTIKLLKLPRKKLGFNLDNWQRSLYEGVVYSIPILIFIVIVKWVAIKFTPYFSGHALFEPFSGVSLEGGAEHSWSTWGRSVLLYVLFVVPLQEVITRISLQAPMQYMLTGRYRNVLAIFASNLIFAAAHTYASSWLVLLVFFPGLYFGWLFLRQRNLIGCMVAHILLGGFALFGLGIFPSH
ncbi:MAG: cyclic nucleotide-binding domain-containing protein [Gammaproteobacteria bacterium]|nr:cyclic nucleotide-binding domain-containing protein [Gammaproteobacteria bacterium]